MLLRMNIKNAYIYGNQKIEKHINNIIYCDIIPTVMNSILIYIYLIMRIINLPLVLSTYTHSISIH